MTSVQIAPDTTGIPEARDYRMFVDGRWVEALDGQWTEVTRPVVRGPCSSAACRCRCRRRRQGGGRCARGFPAWRAQHFTGRQRALGRIADHRSTS